MSSRPGQLITRFRKRPLEKYYRSKLVWPALRVKYEPYLTKIADLRKHNTTWEIRWRYPWDLIRYPRVRPKKR